MGIEEVLKGKEPFEIQGKSKEAVLCIHGFIGSPAVFRKLAKKLAECGYSVNVPLLKGHGTVPSDMLKVSYGEWLAQTENEFCELKKRFERVHVVGLSLGGSLATALAANHRDDEKLGSLTLLAPGYAFNRALLKRLGIENFAEAGDRMLPLPTRKPDGGEMDECLFGYDAAPIVCVGELQRLGEETLPRTKEITAPTAVIYSTADRIVEIGLIEQAVRQIPNLSLMRRLATCEHNLPLCEEREYVAELVAGFILSCNK